MGVCAVAAVVEGGGRKDGGNIGKVANFGEKSIFERYSLYYFINISNP